MTRVRAPGRVNLIGDHTDYQDGWCLPFAIDRWVSVTTTDRNDGRVVVASHGFEGSVDLPVDGSVDPSSVEPSWGRIVAAALQLAPTASTGFDATIESTVPVGSGLSSSAATAVALLATIDAELSGTELALAAQRVEHVATGVPCGVMDQMASVHGRAGHALLLDCRSLTIAPVPLPAGELVVIHSGLPRTLAGSAYADRRNACASAAQRIGVAALRDADASAAADDPFARHVVSENQRVLECAEALRRGDLDQVGRLMLASHASLRDDFAVSTPELDLLVDLAMEHGAYGARLTGAGFGGCVVALTPTGAAVGDAIAARYASMTGLVAQAFTVNAVDGVTREED